MKSNNNQTSFVWIDLSQYGFLTRPAKRNDNNQIGIEIVDLDSQLDISKLLSQNFTCQKVNKTNVLD
ncbi:hypothetical protein OHW85_23455, partial [Acinetobacter baumannii]|nr:hypothetical protein [Acinetobacter baumannii]